MSSVTDLIDKFDTLYKDIDFEIKHIQNSAKCEPPKCNFSENCSKNMKCDKNIKGILSAAKKIDEDVKATVGKKVKKRKNFQPQKSFMPPIWNEKKLNCYVQNILNDIMTSPVEETKEVIPVETTEKNKPESIERTTIYGENKNDTKKIPTRNVGTNVHFLIHGKEENNLNVKQNLGVKRMNRKTQTSYRNDLKIGANKANEKSFPQRVERVVNNEESVNVNFKKRFNVPNTPQKLTFSASTFTSTNGHKKSTKSDDIIHVVDSNLVTNKTKQMSAIFLPVLSIKSRCCVQKIYNFEVSPAIIEANRKECNKRNVKIVELKRETTCTVPEEKASHSGHVEEILPKEATDGKKTLINIQDVKNVLRHHKVDIEDGKIHIIVEDARKKDKKKKKMRPKEFKKVGHKRIQKQNELDKQKLPVSNENAKIECEADSSSLTDNDRKLCDILKFYGETKKIGNKHENILSHEDRYTSYPYPTNTSSNETHNNLMTNEVKKGNDLEYNNITESFQSIYKLIEDTFQSNVVETKVYENDEENGASEMNQVIKMSEENIRKAEMLLQKYRITKEETYPLTSDKTQKSPHNSMTEEPKIFDANHEVNLNSERRDKRDDNNANNSCHSKTTSTQQKDMNEGVLIQCQNYATFTEELQDRMKLNIETSDSCVQTTNDKALQTDDNFNWKSRFYFKSVYDNYSNIDFDRSKVLSTKQANQISNINENINNSGTCISF